MTTAVGETDETVDRDAAPGAARGTREMVVSKTTTTRRAEPTEG